MIQLQIYQIVELVLGIFFIWIGTYFISRNPFSLLNWVVFGFIACFGFSILSDPILINSRSIDELAKWQNLTDWAIILPPVLYLHSSILVNKKVSKVTNVLILLAYFVTLLIYCIDVQGVLIVQRSVVRSINYADFGIFAPGKLFIPTVLIMASFIILGIINFLNKVKQGLKKFLLPALGGIALVFSAVLILVRCYIDIPYSDVYFTFLVALGTFLFVYPITRFCLFSASEKIIFGRSFYYQSIGLFIIILLYLGGIFISGISLDFSALILLVILCALVIFTHSFYDWFTTFINDILYNASSGFSVVNDEEIYQTLKNFDNQEQLENSPLLRLNIVKQAVRKNSLLPVDAVREVIDNSINYFKPKDNFQQRIKRNLKHHLLKMFVIDQAEEGQILWELGFDEYPVRIMSRERNLRAPLFQVKSPSDYTYTSRNAYLALKKEAIHDVAWRISYLEKMSKRKVF